MIGYEDSYTYNEPMTSSSSSSFSDVSFKSSSFYHWVSYWSEGVKLDRYYSSEASNADEAMAERCKIAMKYGRSLIAASTHSI